MQALRATSINFKEPQTLSIALQGVFRLISAQTREDNAAPAAELLKILLVCAYTGTRHGFRVWQQGNLLLP